MKEGTTMDYKAIATEIYSQFGGNRAGAMIGMYNQAYDGSAASPNFSSRFKATAKNGINHVKIELTAMDDYTVKFGKIRGTDFKVVKTVEGVYADMLQDVFENETGLYLSL